MLSNTKYYVYGLIDPATHAIRYVGQTKRSPEPRIRQHRLGHVATTAGWVRSLPEPPLYVLLETGINSRVQVGTRSRPVYTSAATVAETKWIKRFRHHLINRRLRDNCADVWDSLVNPGETCRAQ